MPGGDGAEGGHSKRLRTEAEADGGGMQVELKIFVGAEPNDGREWIKQSSPVLDWASNPDPALFPACQAVSLSCPWLPLLQERFAEKGHIVF
ncbi:hypothetical protein TURU_058037 [Turdus rufiventris]|nr:hypothetical protein TURU_058037 [Turdus rufiventris]